MKFPLLLVIIATLTLTAAAQAAKTTADFAKRIADATPASLPQSPKDGRPRSDAQDVGLKGKVRSVVYRVNDDANLNYPRMMLTLEEFYGEDGDLVRTVDWDSVHPLGVNVYGYLDGMRVSRRGEIDFSDCNNPGGMPCGRVMHTLPSSPDPVAKADERYDLRWVYKYDSLGRMVEETHLDNTGKLLTRTVSSYEPGNRRVQRHYGGGTEPLAKLEETLDPATGRVIELRMFDEDDKVNSIRFYSYKVDAQGNWIVQTVTEKIPGQRSKAKPVDTTFRTITYY